MPTELGARFVPEIKPFGFNGLYFWPRCAFKQHAPFCPTKLCALRQFVCAAGGARFPLAAIPSVGSLQAEVLAKIDERAERSWAMNKLLALSWQEAWGDAWVEPTRDCRN
jgi:hypothetical protein